MWFIYYMSVLTCLSRIVKKIVDLVKNIKHALYLFLFRYNTHGHHIVYENCSLFFVFSHRTRTHIWSPTRPKDLFIKDVSLARDNSTLCRWYYVKASLTLSTHPDILSKIYIVLFHYLVEINVRNSVFYQTS